MKNLFNIRVYGILVNRANEVLLSDERLGGIEFTKFPGGGLEYGEGLVDGLAREFREECQLDIEIVRHVYTTEHFVRSIFNESQVIAVHYEVYAHEDPKGRFTNKRYDFVGKDNDEQAFRWVSLGDLSADDLTFEIDKEAWCRFLTRYNR